MVMVVVMMMVMMVVMVVMVMVMVMMVVVVTVVHLRHAASPLHLLGIRRFEPHACVRNRFKKFREGLRFGNGGTVQRHCLGR